MSPESRKYYQDNYGTTDEEEMQYILRSDRQQSIYAPAMEWLKGKGVDFPKNKVQWVDEHFPKNVRDGSKRNAALTYKPNQKAGV
jgi:hypothetical protein